MKKKIFMYFLIGLFVFFMFLYTYSTIENYLVKAQDVINEELDDKDIVIFQEIIEDNTTSGKYLLNNGDIYSYSYEYKKDLSFEERINYMKNNTGSKVDKIKKKDKGYINMYAPDLKYSYFKRTTKTDRPSKKIYYIDYEKKKLKVINSSGEEVMKNKSISASRIISMLKKYSIRVD